MSRTATDINTVTFQLAVALSSRLGLALGGTIYWRSMPPGSKSTPTDTIGVIPVSTPINVQTQLDRYGFQILIRGKQVGAGLELAHRVYDALHDRWLVLPSCRGRMVCQAAPGTYYRDSQDQPVYPLNFDFLGHR